MEPLRPIFWGQGMFLQPQHFQQQDWYHDARLRYYFHLFLPFCWGLRSLVINEPALQNFTFDVERCDLVTWEGTIVRFHGDNRPSNTRLEPRSFEQELDPRGAPLSVYLGLRRVQLDEGNVAEGTNLAGGNGEGAPVGTHRRFRLEQAETPDLCSDAVQACVMQYLTYDAHVLFDVPASRSQDYELVKIAELVRSPEGKGAVLSRQYVPPCVALTSSPVLEAMLKETRDLLTAKGRELAEYRRRRGGETVELGSRDIGYLLVAQTVNRYIPPLHHYLEVGDIHPYVAYGLLRQLVGELSTFSDSVSVLGAGRGQEVLPPYNHEHIWLCVDLAMQRIKLLLDDITTGPVGEVVLRHDGEYFSAALEEVVFAGDNRYYLAIKSDLTPPQLFRILQDTGKITAREEMPKLQKSFLFGLKIEVLESAPEELLMRAHYRYFLIDRRSDHWQKIEQYRTIAVFCSSLPPETEMRLLFIHS